MQNYLVFKGEDFVGAFSTLEEARAKARLTDAMCGEDWYQIVDLSTGKIVEEGTDDEISFYRDVELRKVGKNPLVESVLEDQLDDSAGM